MAQCTTYLGHTQGPHGLTSTDDVKVDGKTATAKIVAADKSTGTVHLVERHHRWLIDGIEFTSLGD